MEKENSTTRKQKRKPAIVDTEIPGNWNLKNMIDFPRKERMIKNGTKADRLYSLRMNALVRGELEKGHDYLKKAYLLGDLNAGNTLAYGYSVGWFGYKDYDAFIQIVRKLAKKSHPTAMSNYAWAYQNGIGVKKNSKWMKFWFLKAVDAGCMIAKSNLGLYYIFGNPKDRNEEEGVRLCFEAATHGQEMAMNALGQCYEEGIVVTKNYKKAFKWYSMAVENGAGAYAEKNLARCYRFGIGVEVNMDKARKLIKVAMKHGYQPKNIQKTNIRIMIIDSQTNKVYLAQGLLHYMPAYMTLLKALSMENINNAFLPQTESVKHIWTRDYMPIQLEQNKFLQYRYQPDYLKGFEDYIPNYDFICNKLKLNCIKTDIILDGGNVIKCGNKVIMTDKIFQENFHKEKNDLIKELEELFQAELVLVPWDRYEMYGHADGMVRYIRGNIVLLNNYVDFDKKLRQHLLKILSAHFIVEELEYGLPSGSKMSWAYLNFLQTEKCIFVPGLSSKEDQMAVEQIQQLYPQHKVILIEGFKDIVKDGGALNCISWNILEETSDK